MWLLYLEPLKPLLPRPHSFLPPFLHKKRHLPPTLRALAPPSV